MSDDEVLPDAPTTNDDVKNEKSEVQDSPSASPEEDSDPAAQETNNVKLEDLFNDDDDDDDEYPFSSATEQGPQSVKTEYG